MTTTRSRTPAIAGVLLLLFVVDGFNLSKQPQSADSTSSSKKKKNRFARPLDMSLFSDQTADAWVSPSNNVLSVLTGGVTANLSKPNQALSRYQRKKNVNIQVSDVTLGTMWRVLQSFQEGIPSSTQVISPKPVTLSPRSSVSKAASQAAVSSTSSSAKAVAPTKARHLSQILAVEGDWTAYWDITGTGLVFYHNAKTKASRWIPPSTSFPEVHPPQIPNKKMKSCPLVTVGSWSAYFNEHRGRRRIYYHNSITRQTTFKKPFSSFPMVRLPLASQGDWAAYKGKGSVYYFNHDTGKSQWESPKAEDFPAVLESGKDWFQSLFQKGGKKSSPKKGSPSPKRPDDEDDDDEDMLESVKSLFGVSSWAPKVKEQDEDDSSFESKATENQPGFLQSLAQRQQEQFKALNKQAGGFFDSFLNKKRQQESPVAEEERVEVEPPEEEREYNWGQTIAQRERLIKQQGPPVEFTLPKPHEDLRKSQQDRVQSLSPKVDPVTANNKQVVAAMAQHDPKALAPKLQTTQQSRANERAKSESLVQQELRMALEDDSNRFAIYLAQKFLEQIKKTKEQVEEAKEPIISRELQEALKKQADGVVQSFAPKYKEQIKSMQEQAEDFVDSLIPKKHQKVAQEKADEIVQVLSKKQKEQIDVWKEHAGSLIESFIQDREKKLKGQLTENIVSEAPTKRISTEHAGGIVNSSAQGPQASVKATIKEQDEDLERVLAEKKRKMESIMAQEEALRQSLAQKQQLLKNSEDTAEEFMETVVEPALRSANAELESLDDQNQASTLKSERVEKSLAEQSEEMGDYLNSFMGRSTPDNAVNLPPPSDVVRSEFRTQPLVNRIEVAEEHTNGQVSDDGGLMKTMDGQQGMKAVEDRNQLSTESLGLVNSIDGRQLPTPRNRAYGDTSNGAIPHAPAVAAGDEHSDFQGRLPKRMKDIDEQNKQEFVRSVFVSNQETQETLAMTERDHDIAVASVIEEQPQTITQNEESENFERELTEQAEELGGYIESVNGPLGLSEPTPADVLDMPHLANWKQNPDGTITGTVRHRGKEVFPLDAEITTGAVVLGAQVKSVVTTELGGQYYLL